MEDGNTCKDCNGLKVSTNEGRTRIEVPSDFVSDGLGSHKDQAVKASEFLDQMEVPYRVAVPAERSGNSRLVSRPFVREPQHLPAKSFAPLANEFLSIDIGRPGMTDLGSRERVQFGRQFQIVDTEAGSVTGLWPQGPGGETLQFSMAELDLQSLAAGFSRADADSALEKAKEKVETIIKGIPQLRRDGDTVEGGDGGALPGYIPPADPDENHVFKPTAEWPCGQPVFRKFVIEEMLYTIVLYERAIGEWIEYEPGSPESMKYRTLTKDGDAKGKPTFPQHRTAVVSACDKASAAIVASHPILRNPEPDGDTREDEFGARMRAAIESNGIPKVWLDNWLANLTEGFECPPNCTLTYNWKTLGYRVHEGSRLVPHCKIDCTFEREEVAVDIDGDPIYEMDPNREGWTKRDENGKPIPVKIRLQRCAASLQILIQVKATLTGTVEIRCKG